MLDFDTSNSKSEVLKSNSRKITSFSKTMLLQREPFLTMFYTNNSSPLLVTRKLGFMLIIILSNYPRSSWKKKPPHTGVDLGKLNERTLYMNGNRSNLAAILWQLMGILVQTLVVIIMVSKWLNNYCCVIPLCSFYLGHDYKSKMKNLPQLFA